MTQINQEMLDSLHTPSVWSTAYVTGKMPRGSYPTDEDLELKIGAQVIFVKNDADGRFANGTIGKIVDIRESTFHVEQPASTSPPQISPSFLPK